MKTGKLIGTTLLAATTLVASIATTAAAQTRFEFEKNSRDGCVLLASVILPSFDATHDKRMTPNGFLGFCQNQLAFNATPAECTAWMLAMFRRLNNQPTSFGEPDIVAGCLMLLTGVSEAIARKGAGR